VDLRYYQASLEAAWSAPIGSEATQVACSPPTVATLLLEADRAWFELLDVLSRALCFGQHWDLGR